MPREMFILPKSIARLIITMELDRYKIINKTKEPLEGELLCKILGVLRIAPGDMYAFVYRIVHLTLSTRISRLFLVILKRCAGEKLRRHLP